MSRFDNKLRPYPEPDPEFEDSLAALLAGASYEQVMFGASDAYANLAVNGAAESELPKNQIILMAELELAKKLEQHSTFYSTTFIGKYDLTPREWAQILDKIAIPLLREALTMALKDPNHEDSRKTADYILTNTEYHPVITSDLLVQKYLQGF